MKYFFSSMAAALIMVQTHAQNVGIGTTQPKARLHVADSSVVFSANGSASAQVGNPPSLVTGRHLLWYAPKGTFRAGLHDADYLKKDSMGYYSVAMGNKTTATANNATAMGSYTKASGENATTFGFVTKATARNATAMGEYTEANGIAATAMGYYSIASSTAATAMGYFTNASGNSSTAMGYNTNASGFASTAFGFYNNAPSYLETAMGSFNETYSPAGTASWVATDRLFSIGNGNGSSSRSNAVTVLKNGNVGIGTTTPGSIFTIQTDWGYGLEHTNSLVSIKTQIGNGWGSIGTTSQHPFKLRAGNKEAILLMPNGNVGIGLSSLEEPASKLDVNGRIRIRQTGVTAGIGFDGKDASDNPLIDRGFVGMVNNDYVGFYGSGGASWGMAMNVSNANVIIGGGTPDQKLSVNGNASKTGGGIWAAFSDARVKQNVTNYTPGLTEILAIRPVSFQYNNLSGYADVRTRYVGVIAQEVEKVLPNAVTKTNSNPAIKDLRSFDGSELTYTLINAIKEQQAQIEAGRKENAALVKRLEALEAALLLKTNAVK